MGKDLSYTPLASFPEMVPRQVVVIVCDPAQQARVVADLIASGGDGAHVMRVPAADAPTLDNEAHGARLISILAGM